MGGYGITEDCPGFLGQKWMDAQLEATYEGPEAVQRRQMSVTMVDAALPRPAEELVARAPPPELAPTPAPAPAPWPRPSSSGSGPSGIWRRQWTPTARSSTPRRARGSPSSWPTRSPGWWRRAPRCSTSSSWPTRGGDTLGDALPGTARFFADLCHVQAARAAGEVGRICAELVHGYNRHPPWDEAGRKACWDANEAEAMEGIVAGLAGCAFDIVQPGGGHPDKEGPCASCQGITDFRLLRAKLDGCLTGRAARQGPRRRGRHPGHDPRGPRLPRLGRPLSTERAIPWSPPRPRRR